MPGASTDSSAVCPKSVWPLVTVSKLVPRLLISAISPADEEDESPRTATMAATPIAIPSAERAARSLRVRKPTLASRARSRGAAAPGRGRRAAGLHPPRHPWLLRLTATPGPRCRCSAHRCGRQCRRRSLSCPAVGTAVGEDAPVEQLDHPSHALGNPMVMGDDDDGGPFVVQLGEEVEHRLAGARVKVARSARRRGAARGGRRGRARQPPAGVARRRAWSVARRACPKGRPGRAHGRQPGGAR